MPSTVHSLRVDNDEWARIKALAGEAGMSVNGYVVQRALAAPSISEALATVSVVTEPEGIQAVLSLRDSPKLQAWTAEGLRQVARGVNALAARWAA